MEIHISSEFEKAKAINKIAGLEPNGRYVVSVTKTQKKRSGQQNKALHLYLNMMAVAFNEAGLDQKMVVTRFSEGFSVPVTMEFLKHVFKIVMAGMYDKTSTAKLSTVEMQEVYKVFNRGMGEKYGISCVWPHRENKP